MKKLLFLFFFIFLFSCAPVKNIEQEIANNENYVKSNAKHLELYIEPLRHLIYVKSPDNRKIYTDAIFYYKCRYGTPDDESNYNTYNYASTTLIWNCAEGKYRSITFRPLYFYSMPVWTPETIYTSDCIK